MFLLLFVAICCYLLLFVAVWCYLMLFVVIHCPYLLLLVIDCCYSLSLLVAICYYLLLFPNNASYNGLHELRQCQPDASLLWDASDACFALSFTRSEAMSGQRIATVWSPRWMFAIVFYTHWSKVRPTDCFCAIAQMRALYYVLHALRQYRNRSPDACFVLLCVNTGAISG